MSKRGGQGGGGWGALLMLLTRFAIGQHLDGRKRSDATFWARGTYADPHWWGRGGESWWALIPGWRRAAIRWAGLGVLFGLLADRPLTEWVLALAGGPAAGYLAWRGLRACYAWQHYREKVQPVHYALAPVLGIPAATPPRAWLDIPPSYGTDPDAEIVIYPPDDFTAADGDKALVKRTLTAKLGIEDPDVAWELHGRRPRIVATQSVPPPARVLAASVRGEIEAAAEHELILGIGKKDQLIKVSVDTETPHIGLCMGTGDGKSYTAMNLAAQFLWHGGLVVVLDYKLLSHMWARGLPNVAYAGTPAEIHVMLMWLAGDDESELTRRKHVALASADIRGNVQADVGPRILIVAEELNATQKRLKAFWRSLGGKGPSPAAEALDEIHFTGRQLRVHVLDIAQRLSARASGSDGSADARENIGTIVFSNPSPSTWKMLTDGSAQPPGTDHKGRYQVYSRRTVREMQGVLWTEEAAREYALAGTVAVPRHDMPFVVPGPPVAPVAPGRDLVPVGSDLPFVVRQAAPVAPRPADVVTLREAADAGMFPSKSAAARAVQRARLEAAGELGTAKLYRLTDLAGISSQKVRISR